jgi:hypothetical protein
LAEKGWSLVEFGQQLGTMEQTMMDMVEHKEFPFSQIPLLA